MFQKTSMFSMNLEEINVAVTKLLRIGTLCSLTDTELKVIPEYFLFRYKRDIYKVWNKLSPTFTSSRCVEDFYPCKIHYNQGCVQFDGPLPLVYECRKCQEDEL